MLVYIPAIVLVFLQAFYAENFKNKYDETKKKGYFVAFLGLILGIFAILFFVSGFRYGIGIDYFYTDNRIINGLIDGGKEGFGEIATTKLALLLINSGVKNPNLLFFLFFAFFTNIAFVTAIFINKENKYVLPTFILIFYMLFFTSMNQMRQSLGLACGLLAFAMIYRSRKVWVSILAFVIALVPVCFHYSTIVNIVPLIVYLILRKWNSKISTKALLITIGVLFILAPIGFFTLKYTIQYIPVIKKYKYFFDPTFDQTATPFVKFLASVFMFIIPMINFVYAAFILKKKDDYNVKTIIFIEGIEIVLMMFGVCMNSIIFADRLKTLFYMLELIFIPYLFNASKEGKGKYGYLILVCGIMSIWTIATLPTSGLYPYRSILFPDIIIY